MYSISYKQVTGCAHTQVEEVTQGPKYQEVGSWQPTYSLINGKAYTYSPPQITLDISGIYPSA